MNTLSAQEQRASTEFIQLVRFGLGNQVLGFTLFGSRARGEGHAESDLDVLVLVTQKNSLHRQVTADAAADIFLKYEVDIAPLVLSRAEFNSLKQHERLLAQEIERDGIAL